MKLRFIAWFALPLFLCACQKTETPRQARPDLQSGAFTSLTHPLTFPPTGDSLALILLWNTRTHGPFPLTLDDILRGRLPGSPADSVLMSLPSGTRDSIGGNITFYRNMLLNTRFVYREVVHLGAYSTDNGSIPVRVGGIRVSGQLQSRHGMRTPGPSREQEYAGILSRGDSPVYPFSSFYVQHPGDYSSLPVSMERAGQIQNTDAQFVLVFRFTGQFRSFTDVNLDAAGRRYNYTFPELPLVTPVKAIIEGENGEILFSY